MESFKIGHASTKEWQEAAQTCLIQMGDTSSANFGFLYITDLFVDNISDILAYFKQNTSVLHWIGGVGIGICSQAKEYIDVPAIAVMLGYFPESSFAVFPTVNKDLAKFSNTHQLWCDNNQAMFGIVHGDPQNKHIPKLISQISERLDEGFIVGGFTSSRHQHSQIADNVVEGGLSGVLFSSSVNVFTRLTQGCIPLGPRHQVTESSNNIVIRIDDQPALDIFKEDIGQELAKNLNKVANNISAALPIRGSDVGDYMVRNIIGIDPEHKLLAIGDQVSQGMPIMFVHRDNKVAETSLVQMLDIVKKRLNGNRPKGGLYISCVGRGENLFGKNSTELVLIQKKLGDFPLIGFLASGEIYYQQLHHYAGVLVLFL